MTETTTRDPLAVQVLRKYLELIAQDIDTWSELLHSDATIDFPYAVHLGIPRFLNGKDAIVAHMKNVTKTMQRLRISDVVIYPVVGAPMAIAEFHADALIGPEKVPYSQDYISILEIKDSKVLRVREYWDPIRVGEVIKGAAQPPAVQS